jgi:hypothetical protein
MGLLPARALRVSPDDRDPQFGRKLRAVAGLYLNTPRRRDGAASLDLVERFSPEITHGRIRRGTYRRVLGAHRLDGSPSSVVSFMSASAPTAHARLGAIVAQATFTSPSPV